MITVGVVNELSFPDQNLHIDISSVVDVVAYATTIETQFALENWPPGFASSPLAVDWQQLVQRIDRDKRLIFLRAASRQQGAYALGADFSVYSTDGCEGKGLRMSLGSNALLVSCDTIAEWTVRFVDVLLVRIDDGASGSPDGIIEEARSLPNASETLAFDFHRERTRAAALANTVSAEGLWADRIRFLPNVTLLGGVESQLRQLDPIAFAAVRDELNLLQLAILGWKPDGSPTPVWLSKVTPESKSREELCYFPDGAGITRAYSLHSRFTPGPGRIHFRIVSRDRLEVAYVGRKLGI